MGSCRERQEGLSRPLRHVLRSPAARALLPRPGIRWFFKRSVGRRWNRTLHRRRQSRQPECDSNFSGIANPAGLRALALSAGECQSWLFAQSAAVPVAELPAVRFPQPELFECDLDQSLLSAARISTLRLSPVEKFR